MKMELTHQHQMLLEVLRVCARELLIEFDRTQQSELYTAFERAAEACECLYFMNNESAINQFH